MKCRRCEGTGKLTPTTKYRQRGPGVQWYLPSYLQTPHQIICPDCKGNGKKLR